jgi:hypothetical protein
MSGISPVSILRAAKRGIEEQINRFRQGSATRMPDRFSDIGHSVARFFKGLTVCFRGVPEPNVEPLRLNSWEKELRSAEVLVRDAAADVFKDLEENQPKPYGEDQELVPPVEPQPEHHPTDDEEFIEWGENSNSPNLEEITRSPEVVQRERSESTDQQAPQLSEDQAREIAELLESLVGKKPNTADAPVLASVESGQEIAEKASPPTVAASSNLRKRHRIEHKPNVTKLALVQGDPPKKILQDALAYRAAKNRENLQKREEFKKFKRTNAVVFRKRPAEPDAAPKNVAEPAAAVAAIDAPLMPSKSALRKHKAADRTVDAWQNVKAIAAPIGSPDKPFLSVLKEARREGPANLHHTALGMIEHLKKSVGDIKWEQEARRVLAGEITSRQVAKDKRLLHDLRALAHHFETYQQSQAPEEIAPDDLEDLKALGTLFTELLENATKKSGPSNLRDAAKLALERDLQLHNPGGYLLGDREGARLARHAMQQETDRVVSALTSAVANHAQDAAIVGRSELSTMTKNEAEAVCRLMNAFLHKAYDFDNKDSALRGRIDEVSRVYLDDAAQVIKRRTGKAVEMFVNTRDFYADALVLVPLQEAIAKTGDPSAARIAELISYLALRLFKAGRELTGLSEAARPVFQAYLDNHGDGARTALML